MSRDKGFYQASKDSATIFKDNGPGPKNAPSEKYYSQLNVPGWVKSKGPDGPPTKALLYDDMYVAIGANAVSRVDLGDASGYLGNTRLKILLPITWEEGKIKISIAELEGVSVSDSYLYIIDNEGKFNTNGYPLK